MLSDRPSRCFAGIVAEASGFGNPTLDRAVQGIQGYPAIRGREQQLIG
jgi:hypothetical protein